MKDDIFGAPLTIRDELDVGESLGYKLEAYTFQPPGEPKGLMVMAYGIPRGQENNKEYAPDRFAPYMAEVGFTATAHSPAGLGRSGGDTFQSCLARRVDEMVAVAEAAHEAHLELSVTLYGSSMGAHVAIRAAQRLHEKGMIVDNLVLVSSAAYPDRSEEAAFGEAFRQAITGAHELKRSDFSIFNSLVEFPGKVIFAWVEFDSSEKGGPIFPQIIEWYNGVYEERKKSGKQDGFITVMGVEHAFRVDGLGIDESEEAKQLYRSFCAQLADEISERV